MIKGMKNISKRSKACLTLDTLRLPVNKSQNFILSLCAKRDQ